MSQFFFWLHYGWWNIRAKVRSNGPTLLTEKKTYLNEQMCLIPLFCETDVTEKELLSLKYALFGFSCHSNTL